MCHGVEMVDMLKVGIPAQAKETLEELSKQEGFKSVSNMIRQVLADYCRSKGVETTFNVGSWGGKRYPTEAEMYSDPGRYVESARIENERVYLVLADGTELSAPLYWYPWLESASPENRANMIVHHGGAEWPDLQDGITADAMAKGPNNRIKAIIAERQNSKTPHD